jgi:sec-independent protein translocase protein TatA
METLLLFFNMGGQEILLILLIILIFFGAKKIPELARGLGRGIREFKDATREIKDEVEEAAKEKPASVHTNSAPKEATKPL